jgi:hypothetical protein
MRVMTQKRIALFFVTILFILAIVPAFYPVEDEAVPKDSTIYRAYGQLYTSLNGIYVFDCNLGWTRTSSKLDSPWTLPSVPPSTSQTRAPPA